MIIHSIKERGSKTRCGIRHTNRVKASMVWSYVSCQRCWRYATDEEVQLRKIFLKKVNKNFPVDEVLI